MRFLLFLPGKNCVFCFHGKTNCRRQVPALRHRGKTFLRKPLYPVIRAKSSRAGPCTPS